MTVTNTSAGTQLAQTRTRVTSAVARAATRKRLVLTGIGVLFLVSVVRVVTDATDLTSSGTFEAALRLAVPIMLAGLGGLYAERSGVVNIGLEGMMILGTWFGAWAGWLWGPWWGVLFGILGGAAGGLLHAIATITFDVNHIVSGVALNTLGAGVARFLSSIAFTPDTGGGVTQSPIIGGHIGHVSVPFLAGGDLFGWTSPDVFGWLEDKHWIVVSDLAALLHALTGNLSWLTVLAIALVPFTYWLLWRTRFGLRLRSVGENPSAAESLGVPVYRMKYIGVTISGALAGFAGAFLALISAGIYKEGQTGGRGFIGLAAMIFGNWRPAGVLVGAGLFGFADALQLRSLDAVHALLLLVGLGVAAFAVRSVLRRRLAVSAVLAVVATGFLLWYFRTDSVPEEFVFFTPHVVTLIVLASATQRLRMPAADGLSYRKGQVQ
jgi:simple sugar transport system permease protein